MRHSWSVLCVLLVVGCAARDVEERALPAATASDPAPRLDTRGGGIEAQLFPTELVMDHQAALGLTEAQDEAIRAELAAAQRELVEAEWALGREREQLATLLGRERVDETAAMEAADRVIERENAIKRLHLRLLIRIKNQLSPQQRQALARLRGA